MGVGVKNDRNNFYIIYPHDMKKSSSDLLAMADLIINGIVCSSNDTILININSNAMLVECNDNSLKNIINILLNAKKLDSVKELLRDLLHKDVKNSNNLGILRCHVKNTDINYTVKEIKPSPDFAWTIQKKNN